MAHTRMTSNETSIENREYRKVLIAAEQKSQEEFDKTVLSLSGGALGVSFVFLKDVIGDAPVAVPWLLIAAWVCWGLSTLAVLASYHLSVLTIRCCIRQIDLCQHEEKFGGEFARWTAWLNVAGAVLFFAGVLSITVFAGVNFSNKGADNVRTQATAAAASPSSSATATAKSKP